MVFYTEMIDGCKTSPNRAIRWARCHDCNRDGVLEVHDAYRVRKFLVTEIHTGTAFNGRGFELLKPSGEKYHCFIAKNRKQSTCDCPAGCYGKVDQCCHIQALIAVIGNGWLEDAQDDPRPTAWPYEMVEA